MAAPIRDHRVEALCDWLCTLPPEPPFHQRAEFKFFADITPREMLAAQQEMRRRGDKVRTKAERMRAQLRLRHGI
ncbi:MAG: hypothetical protein AAGK17_13495 [Pseudomonadota bacterium]